MADHKYVRALLLAMLAALLYPIAVQALDVGFEGLLSVEASDNVNAVNAPDEEDGVTVGGLLGVYGEQRSPRMTAAFTGEIDTRREVSDDDADFETITRFLGAAEVSLTPRSWRWYVGDILGGVRSDNAVQTIDDTEIDRRNVFVTGPSFEYDVAGRSRTRARLLYVYQTQEQDVLETLYTANFSYERDTIPGSYFGFRAGNVFTDLPDAADNPNLRQEGDYNRATASMFANRLRGFIELYGELGITRYDAEDESLNGMNAQVIATRRLGPMTTISASIGRDLNDQTLSTIESLIESGNDAVGVRPEAAGFYAETRLDLGYSFQSSLTSIDLGIGLSQLDYQLLAGASQAGLNADSEDQVQFSAFGSLSRRLTSRLRGELSLSYERQDYDNRRDETDSILALAKVVYRLNTSFQLEAGLIHDTAAGVLTRFSSGTGVEEDIDITENRVTIGVRWAPPSRASRDLTVELKSLLR